MDNNKNNNNKPNNSNGKKPNNNKTGLIICLIAAVCMLAMYLLMSNQLKESSHQLVAYDEFLDMLEEGKVKSVDLKSNEITITPILQENQLYEMTYYTGYAESFDVLTARLLKANVKISPEVQNTGNSIVDFFVVYVLPLLILWVILFFVFRMVSKSGGG
ncbi:MAG: ATP-dependent metallopeptidase FtsH/Yme1/Tma family protein, partial [Acetivibrio sp.]